MSGCKLRLFQATVENRALYIRSDSIVKLRLASFSMLLSINRFIRLKARESYTALCYNLRTERRTFLIRKFSR